MRKLVFIFIFFSLIKLRAQQSQDVFGKNRVQYTQLKWKYISTKNFNIYYTVGKGGNILAHNTARHLETIYDDITNATGYLPYNKVNVLVYTNHADLQQSNISLVNSYSAGGETNLVKSKIEVAFKGDQIRYFKELDTELAKLFVNIIMYGGNFRDAVQSSYLIEFPEWFLSGCSHYLGSGESEEMYDAVNDFLHKKRRNIDKLSGEKAKLVGASIFNYIYKEFGSYSTANVLALAKSTRSEEVGIRAGLGVSYKGFLQGWEQFYLNLRDMNEEEFPNSKVKRTSHHSKITQFKTNPSNTHIAYAINRKGIYYVFIKNLETKKKHLIYYGGTKDISGDIQKHIPLLSWRSNEELALIKFKKGQPFLLTKNVNKRFSKEKKLFTTFEGITSFDFHPNGKEIVLSGVKLGQSDIFTYNIKNNVAKRITYDLYDDHHPVYSPDGKNILFSSNRKNDTLRKDPGTYHTLEENLELYEFTGDKILNKISNSPLNESKGEYLSNNEIIFLASNGTKNEVFSVRKDNKKIAHNISLPGNHVFDFTLTENGIIQKIRIKDRDILESCTLNNLNVAKNYLLIRNHEMTAESQTEIANQVLLNQLLEIDPFKVSYDSDIKGKEEEEKDKQARNNTSDEIRISFPRDIVPQFGMDYVISTIKSDYIRNVGALFEVGTSDMFGDHRLSGSVFTSANLRSYDMNFRYDYLKRRVDLSAQVINDSYFRNSPEVLALQRQGKTEVFGTASLPLSPVARLSFSSGFSRTTFINYFNINGSAQHDLYGKNSLTFVYDNATEKSINSLQGFRLKSGFTHLGKIAGTAPGFTKFTFDMRNYQPIFKDMVFATRFSYGSYGGTLPRVFVMGGVDNWLLQQYETNSQFDPFFFSNDEGNPYFLYSDFTTNLRGFGFNKINGRRHLLLNSELRIPIVKMLYSAPVSSSFFRNLQVNLFYEIGSAWNGSSPFNKDNSINTRNIGGPPLPFSAVVTNYQNPFLSSYGFGIRSMMFGYYMKMDLGWGIKNFIVQRPKLQVSLGYDF